MPRRARRSWRAPRTVACSPSWPRRTATSSRPRIASPRPSRRRCPRGQRRASHATLKPGSSPWRAIVGTTFAARRHTGYPIRWTTSRAAVRCRWWRSSTLTRSPTGDSHCSSSAHIRRSIRLCARHSCSRRCSASTRIRSRARSRYRRRRWRNDSCAPSAASATRASRSSYPSAAKCRSASRRYSRQFTAPTRSTSLSSPVSSCAIPSPPSRTISPPLWPSCFRKSLRRWASPRSSRFLSREPARGTAGEFVPLDEQDSSLWDTELIALGERLLHRARSLGGMGRFQIEAAIQSVHCARATSGVTDWHVLRTLHAALVAIAPTLGARVAHAAAVGRVEGAQAGLEALDAITDDAVQRFQPAWATRAHLLAEAGRAEAAVTAFERALSLTTDSGARRYLERRRAQLSDGSR